MAYQQTLLCQVGEVWKMLTVARKWKMMLPINILSKAQGSSESLSHLKDKVKHHLVTVISDNTTFASYMKRQTGTKSSMQVDMGPSSLVSIKPDHNTSFSYNRWVQLDCRHYVQGCSKPTGGSQLHQMCMTLFNKCGGQYFNLFACAVNAKFLFRGMVNNRLVKQKHPHTSLEALTYKTSLFGGLIRWRGCRFALLIWLSKHTSSSVAKDKQWCWASTVLCADKVLKMNKVLYTSRSPVSWWLDS